MTDERRFLIFLIRRLGGMFGGRRPYVSSGQASRSLSGARSVQANRRRRRNERDRQTRESYNSIEAQFNICEFESYLEARYIGTYVFVLGRSALVLRFVR